MTTCSKSLPEQAVSTRWPWYGDALRQASTTCLGFFGSEEDLFFDCSRIMLAEIRKFIQQMFCALCDVQLSAVWHVIYESARAKPRREMAATYRELGEANNNEALLQEADALKTAVCLGDTPPIKWSITISTAKERYSMTYNGTHPGEPDLLAWIGEDECGSGKIGIKQAQVPAGMIPIVGIIDHKTKLTWPAIVQQFQRMSDEFGKEIRLVRYEAVEEIIVIRPGGKEDLVGYRPKRQPSYGGTQGKGLGGMNVSRRRDYIVCQGESFIMESQMPGFDFTFDCLIYLLSTESGGHLLTENRALCLWTDADTVSVFLDRSSEKVPFLCHVFPVEIETDNDLLSLLTKARQDGIVEVVVDIADAFQTIVRMFYVVDLIDLLREQDR